MSPDADPTDGLGEGVVYRTAGVYWATVAGSLSHHGSVPTNAGILRRRWRQARLESSGPLQIDGESQSAGSVSVWMEAGALRVLVAPRPAASS